MTPLLISLLWLFIYYFAFNILRGFYRHCLRPSKNLKARYSNPNLPVWACITGATSGIGLGFARELARRGFNIILVSRSKKKLEDTQAQLKSEFKGVNLLIQVADFGSDQSLKFYKDLAQDISKNDIGLLVNNAGVMRVDSFLDTSPQHIMQMIEVNTFPGVLLTRYMLPKLRARNARSGIINVSSSVAQAISVPYNAVYASTKSFNDFFSLPLAFDNEDKLDILSLRPGAVNTPLLGSPSVPLSVTQSRCVKGALRSLGSENSSNGDFQHGIFSFWISFLPRYMVGLVAGEMFKELRRRQKKGV